MGVRRVVIYTCDGCGAQATLDQNEKARGFTPITLAPREGVFDDKLLCSVCFGAVEWVVKFQGITSPPTAHRGPDGRYRLRKQA